MQPVKHAVHGLCVGDGRPVMSHFGGVTVMTSFLNSSHFAHMFDPASCI